MEGGGKSYIVSLVSSSGKVGWNFFSIVFFVFFCAFFSFFQQQYPERERERERNKKEREKKKTSTKSSDDPYQPKVCVCLLPVSSYRMCL